jgi:hypothetical protein
VAWRRDNCSEAGATAAAVEGYLDALIQQMCSCTKEIHSLRLRFERIRREVLALRLAVAAQPTRAACQSHRPVAVQRAKAVKGEDDEDALSPAPNCENV